MFFNDWSGIVRVVVVGTLAYSGLVLLLRVSGKRTLSKMNAFDFVVTVALGSTLATILLSRDVPLAEGLTAFTLLVGLQYVITWLSVRSQVVQSLVKAQPALLLYRGEFLEKVMKRERMTEAEVEAAVRQQGQAALEEVLAVVLETDGTLTVIPYSEGEETSALENVAHFPPSRGR